MNAWPFVIAAYAVAVAGAGGLILWAFVSMRRAETAAESLKRQ